MRSAALAALLALASPALAEKVEVSGEVIDTWCYFSGVMGGPDAVVGSAHHTCAMWCASGGIPVGVLADDGTIYMVLKWEGAESADGSKAVLDVQSARVTAAGDLHERDGINYIIVSEVLSNDGITNLNHEEFGPVPGFAIPDPNK